MMSKQNLKFEYQQITNLDSHKKMYNAHPLS